MSLFSSPVGDERRRRPRTGLSLLITIFVQEFFRIVALNALFIVCSIPIVTMPAAYAAMTRVNGFYVMELGCDQWKEFFRCFRSEFRRTLPIGLPLLLIPPLVVLLALPQLAHLNTPGGYLLATVCLFIAVMLTMLRWYLFPQLVWTQLSMRDALKNSLLFACIRLKQNLPMLLFEALLTGIVVWYLPFSLPYVAICVFSSLNLFSTFVAWQGIRERVLTKPAEAEHAQKA